MASSSAAVSSEQTEQLSCLRLTGKLDEHTPKCVLEEIAAIHQVPLPPGWKHLNHFVVRDFIQQLEHSGEHQSNITVPPSNDDRILISHFVNSRFAWSPSRLDEAFATIQIYFNAAPLPDTHFQTGLPTPTHPHKLGACILYKICRSQQLTLRNQHTIYHMGEAVRMLIQNPSLTLAKLYRSLSHLTVESLSDIYLAISAPLACEDEDSDFPEEIQEEVQEELEETLSYHDDVTQAAQTFSDPALTRQRVEPHSAGEAIVLAATNFSADISYSAYPILEYAHLRLQTERGLVWLPLDIEMRDCILHNTEAFSLGSYFNPRLPHELYNEQDLHQLALEEGYTSREITQESAYTLLSTNFLSPTFYHGRHTRLKNIQTPIEWLKVEEVPSDCMICHGIQAEDLTVYRYRELTDLFRHNRNFCDPLDLEQQAFTKIAIRKLKRLCEKMFPDETEEGRQERRLLQETINLTELFVDERIAKARDLYLAYQSGPLEEKNQLRRIMRALHTLSMRCRGWINDGDSLPIEVAPVDNQNEVDILVTAAIYDFEQLCGEMEDGGEMIFSLPLLRYRGEWQVSTNITDGSTLGERITILKNGDDHANLSSCMRLSSNWLAASAYRYMKLVELDPGFDIKKLREIF